MTPRASETISQEPGSKRPLRRRENADIERFEATTPTAASQDDDEEKQMPNDTSFPKAPRPSQLLTFIGGALGIYISYLFYGHYQEDLFNHQTADGGSFHHVWFLQSLESTAHFSVGLVARYLWGGGRVPVLTLMGAGATQTISKVWTNLALAAGLSFPVTTMAKSAKVVPVMLGQWWIGGATYGLRDYLFVGLIVTGTAMLSMGEHRHPGKEGNSSQGVIFIVGSLVMDGVTGGVQKRIKASGKVSGQQPSTWDFLFWSSLSMAIIGFGMSLTTGEFYEGVAFLKAHPEVFQLVTRIILCSAVGQTCIFSVIANFDSLVCSTVTTTRKIFSILWSIFGKGHMLSTQGSLGLVLAIAGLLIEVHDKVSLVAEKRTKRPAC